jgi:hypothetical protein
MKTGWLKGDGGSCLERACVCACVTMPRIFTPRPPRVIVSYLLRKELKIRMGGAPFRRPAFWVLRARFYLSD